MGEFHPVNLCIGTSELYGVSDENLTKFAKALNIIKPNSFSDLDLDLDMSLSDETKADMVNKFKDYLRPLCTFVTKWNNYIETRAITLNKLNGAIIEKWLPVLVNTGIISIPYESEYNQIFADPQAPTLSEDVILLAGYNSDVPIQLSRTLTPQGLVLTSLLLPEILETFLEFVRDEDLSKASLLRIKIPAGTKLLYSEDNNTFVLPPNTSLTARAIRPGKFFDEPYTANFDIVDMTMDNSGIVPTQVIPAQVSLDLPRSGNYTINDVPYVLSLDNINGLIDGRAKAGIPENRYVIKYNGVPLNKLNVPGNVLATGMRYMISFGDSGHITDNYQDYIAGYKAMYPGLQYKVTDTVNRTTINVN